MIHVLRGNDGGLQEKTESGEEEGIRTSAGFAHVSDLTFAVNTVSLEVSTTCTIEMNTLAGRDWFSTQNHPAAMELS